MAGTTLGTAYVQIVPSAQGIKGSITNALGGEAESAGSDIGSKLGMFAKKALAKVAIGTAVIGGVKTALSEGAKLQQSYFGGLDTLYGEAAGAARNYAREAAAAGISMNSYSEQAVSFGAALKNAFGGDVTKAAQAANQAILDMADNSAKMGTDITSVQMAYQGFAKQNYTMLDNLKLGYGGTKTEMERLLADAQELSGVEYNIDNLGDVYEAIHVIQGELGLTGVAAAEASETFSGSFNAMKASAQNFLGSLAIGEGVNQSMNQLVTSASTFFFGNFLPMVGTLVKSLPGAIATFLKQGLPLLVSNISSLLSNLATSVTAFAKNITGPKVTEWAQTMLPKILAAGASLVGNLASSLLTNLPKIVAAIARIGLAIVSGLGSALWGKVSAAAAGIRDRFMAPINALRDKVRAAINKVKSLFPFSIGKVMSNIKLPHFKLTGKFSLKDMTVPKLSISWYAKGGIIDGATVFGGIGMGEAGPEAILPLNPFWDRMDRLEKNVGSNSGDVTINVYATPNMDINQLAQKIEQRLVLLQTQRNSAYGSV